MIQRHTPVNRFGHSAQFGLHLMIDGYDASPARLADPALLRAMLDQIPATLGLHPIGRAKVAAVGPENRRDPSGWSGFVLTSESHLCFHTFPASRFMTFDLHTCQDDLDVSRLTGLIATALSMTDMDIHLQPRGLRHAPQNRG